MRHKNGFRHFQKSPSHRRAMFRNMATSLILQDSFETTVEKAKDLRRVVERIITIGKTDSLVNRKRVHEYLMSDLAVRRLFKEVGPRMKERNGGYTRVVRTRLRHGDRAQLAVIELVA